jgi:hypothetical protein
LWSLCVENGQCRGSPLRRSALQAGIAQSAEGRPRWRLDAGCRPHPHGVSIKLEGGMLTCVPCSGTGNDWAAPR